MRRRSASVGLKSAGDRKKPRAFTERGAWPFVIVLAVLASVLTFDPRLYINGDNVSYMFLARDVLHGDLWGSSKFPPLFPLLLAPVQGVVGLLRGTDASETPRAALLAQKWLVMAFFAGSLVLWSRLIRRRIHGRTALFVFLFGATLLPVVEYSHYVMSEIPFCFFLLLALDATDRLLGDIGSRKQRGMEAGGAEFREGEASGSGSTGKPDRRTWSTFLRDRASWIATMRDRRLWILSLALAAGFYTRTAGGIAILTIGTVLLFRRRFHEAIALGCVLFVLSLPWIAHSLTSPGGNPYFEQFLLVNPYYPEFGKLDAPRLWQRLSANVVEYGRFHIPVSLLPIPYRSTYSPAIWQNTPPPLWAALPIIALIGIGAVRTARRMDPVTMTVLGSLLLVLAWPPIWAANRFLIPLVPALAWLLWEGLQIGVDRARNRGFVWARSTVLGLLLVVNLLSLDNYRSETEQYDPVWGNYFATIDWVREHTPLDAVIVDRKPGFVEFLSARNSLMFPREPDLDRMLNWLTEKNVDYVLMSHLPYDDIERYLYPLINQRRERFEIVLEIRDPEPDPALNGTAYVFRFLPAAP